MYAELDGRVNASLDPLPRQLEAAGLPQDEDAYPGVDHAFVNDTGGRYDATARRAAA